MIDSIDTTGSDAAATDESQPNSAVTDPSTPAPAADVPPEPTPIEDVAPEPISSEEVAPVAESPPESVPEPTPVTKPEAPIAADVVETPVVEVPPEPEAVIAEVAAEPIAEVVAEPASIVEEVTSPVGEADFPKTLADLVGDGPESEHQPEPEPAAAEAVAEEPPAAEEPAAPAEEAPPPDKKNWYIVKVQSNREDTIREAIERKVKVEGLEEFFGQILVPVEKVSELRAGKRVVRSRKMYPGYIMAYVEFNEQILYLFRDTPGVGDFVGATVTRPPTPMPAREVERMLHSQQATAPDSGTRVPEKVQIPFDKGDRIRVRDGTFNGMEGEVKEIIEPKDPKDVYRVRVELTIFGRPVPVEVEVWQVEAL